MAHVTDEERIEKTHNISRYCINNPQIAWVLLVFTVIWGFFGYYSMPQRKDPDVPVGQAVALTAWPGMSADKIEQLVVKPIDERMADNARVEKLESTARNGIAVNYVYLEDSVLDTAKEFDDIALKLQSVQLPDGAGPINFIRDFGDTAALMLTVASPRITRDELIPRAVNIQQAITAVRAGNRPKAGPGESRVSLIVGFPESVTLRRANEPNELFRRWAEHSGMARDLRVVQGPGFIGLDGLTRADDGALRSFVQHFLRDRLQVSQFHPDSWDVAIIRDPAGTLDKIAAVAGDKYSYQELDKYTELLEKTIKGVSQVAKVERSGLLGQVVFLVYSQERLASYGLSPANIRDMLSARNILMTGGNLDVGGRALAIDPSGAFKTPQDVAGLVITMSAAGTPVYLRDLVDVVPSYETPASFLNYYTYRLAYVVVVVRRVASILRGTRAASGRDLIFFLLVYCCTIVLFALCAIAMQYILKGSGEAAFLLKHSANRSIDFLYFSAITFSGVGFGDIVPVHWSSRIFVAFQAVFGQMFGIMGIGVIINSIMSRRSTEKD